MNRRAAIAILGTLPFALHTQDKQRERATQADSFTEAATAVWKWLESLSGQLDTFVAKENRAQLADRCHDLNEGIHAVESAKGSLLGTIRNSSGSQKDIESIRNQAIQILPKLETLRSAVDKVAILLLEKPKQGGKECEEKLTRAVGDRKLWVASLLSNTDVLTDPQQKADILARGSAAVDALHKASVALADLTVRLRDGS